MPFGKVTPWLSVGYLEFDYYGNEARINKLAYRLAPWLKNGGHMALPTPAGREIPSLRILREGAEPEVFMQGSFDLRLAAMNTRMGEIGLNNYLITTEYGSRLRPGAVITKAVLEADLINHTARRPIYAWSADISASSPVQRVRCPETARQTITSPW